MTLHELGHLFAAQLSGKRIYSVKVLPIGLNARIDESSCNEWEGIIIYFGGPAVNLLLIVLTFIINSYYLLQPDNMRFFISINVYLLAFNMMPVLPLDGGKALRSILSRQKGLFLASRYIRTTTLVLSTFITVLGVIQLFNSLHNFSLFVIGLYLLFSMKSNNTEAALMNVKQIIYRRSRLLKKGIYAARDLVVIKSALLVDTLGNMDFDRFHIIHVLDDELKIVKVFSEQELIEAMLKYNTDMTFEELIKIKEGSGQG